MKSKLDLLALATLLLTGGGFGMAQAQEPSVPERVAALKATIAASQVILKQYEWIETTVVSLKGDEKLNAKAKNLTVVVQNSGYRKTN